MHDRVPQHETSPRIRLVSPGTERTGGRYTRWEKTPTTFGPVGRSVITAVLVTWIVSAFFTMFVVSWLLLASIGGWILKEVWRKGWVPTERIVESGTPATVPEPATTPAPQYIPLRTKVACVGLGVVFLAAAVGFAYGSESVQSVVLMGGSLSLLVGWFAFVLRG